MSIEISDKQRAAVRDWLRAQLRAFDPPFYNARGDHCLVREFYRFCAAQGQNIVAVSLGRYLRGDNSVVLTPDRCSEGAAALHLPAIEVMKQAGLALESDCELPPEPAA